MAQSWGRFVEQRSMPTVRQMYEWTSVNASIEYRHVYIDECGVAQDGTDNEC